MQREPVSLVGNFLAAIGVTEKHPLLKKGRPLKWWQKPWGELPIYHNRIVNERRATELNRRIQLAERRAEEHAAAGRPGRAKRYESKAKARRRELSKLRA